MALNPNDYATLGGINFFTAHSRGTPADVAGLYANQSGCGSLEKTTLILQSVPLALVDNAGVGAHAALQLYNFPAGIVSILGTTANLTVSASSAGVSATFDGDFGIGSVAADTGATLATTEQNMLPTTATPQAVASATTATGASTVDTLTLNGAVTPVDMYLNMLVDDADHDVTTTPANLVVSGTITFIWTILP